VKRISDRQKPVLVTGSEGAIGSYVCSSFPRNTPLIRCGRELSKLKCREMDQCFTGDLGDYEFCNFLNRESDFDTVIYLAGYWRGLECDGSSIGNNVEPVANFLKGCGEKLRHVIYLSSSAVYAGSSDPERSENDFPKSFYGQGKLLCEELLCRASHKYGFDLTIIRPFHVCSPFESFYPGRSHLLTNLYKKIVDNEGTLASEHLPADIYVPLYWVGDLTDVILECLQRPFKGVSSFNVGSASSFSIDQIARCMEERIFYGPQMPRADRTGAEFIGISSEIFFTDGAPRSSRTCRNLEEIVNLFVTEKESILP